MLTFDCSQMIQAAATSETLTTVVAELSAELGENALIQACLALDYTDGEIKRLLNHIDPVTGDMTAILAATPDEKTTWYLEPRVGGNIADSTTLDEYVCYLRANEEC